MVVTSVGQRKAEYPLIKRMLGARRHSLPAKRTNEVSGVTDASDSPSVVQGRDCDEEILPFDEVSSQTRENAPTGEISKGILRYNKKNGEANQKRKVPFLSRFNVLGPRVSSSNRNPSADSMAFDDAVLHLSLLAEEAFDMVAEEVVLSCFFFQCLGESAMGAGNTILSALEQAEEEARLANAAQKVLEGEEKANCQDEQSQMHNGQDEKTKEETFL